MRYGIGLDQAEEGAYSALGALREAVAEAGPCDAGDLARMQLLADLPRAGLEQAFLRIRRKPMGVQADLKSDDLKSCVFFVWSGCYRVTIMSPAGAHVTLRTVLPGGQFGEIAAYARAPHREFHVLVDEPGLLLQMPAALFRDMVCRWPALLQATLTALAHAAVVRADRIYEFATLDMKLRLHAELLRLGAHQGRWAGGRLIISPAPTQDAIAAQIGATREGITRQMKCLVEQGLVQKRRREIVLLDVQRLRAMVERASGICVSHTSKLDFI